MTTLKKAVLAAFTASLFLSGCATESVQQARRYVWPRPPDLPKIEWVKSYYGEGDFPKSGFTVFFETIFGAPAPLLFQKPIDIKSNGKGMVYVTDIAMPGILVYDLINQKVELWSRGTDPDKSLAITPYYLALDGENNVYVVGRGANMIYVLDSKGSVIRKIDYSAQVKSPGALAVDGSGRRIYLVDHLGSKVAVYDLEGKFQFSFGKAGIGDGEFNRPSPIALNHRGEVVVGDVMNARVQIFTKDGKFLRQFGQRGDSGADFQIIKGLSVDSDDNVYVTDGKANQLKIFSAMGDYLLTIGTAYSVTKTMKEAPGGFLLPQGIHIDETDTIYIADQANMRFQVFKYLKGDQKAVDPAAGKQ